MGKIKREEKSTASSRKLKRTKKSRDSQQEDDSNVVTMHEEVPEMAEEVECEEEAEEEDTTSMQDDGDCIDVETAEEEQKQSMANATVDVNAEPIASTSKQAEDAAVKNSTNAKVAAPAPPNQVNLSNSSKPKRKRRDSSTSSEEERWLTAIESGKLVDVDDEMKKIKDPKLMTARQRAMYERGSDKDMETLMSLPTGYREKEKPQTAEEIQKAALKSQKRKQQADAKREKDKKRTMDRLLKKQETKQRAGARNKNNKNVVPMLSYRNTAAGASILLPEGYEFPLKAKPARAPPKVQLCGIAGCGQVKRYNCSKTNIPLCSFACYRKNVQSLRQIIC